MWRGNCVPHGNPWFLGSFIFIIFAIIVTAENGLGFEYDDSIISPVVLNRTDLHLQDNLCPPNQFMCKNGLSCIDKSMVCDNSVDCWDASDEELCPSEIPCREGTFQCKFSRKCIPSGWLCDGVVDCGTVPGLLTEDASDEQDPRCISDKICQPNQFKCSDGVTCIQIAQLCDNLIQCPNKEDEHKYCDNSTACPTPNCLYGCKPSPLGEALCFCPIGQEHDGKGCIESNECMEVGACDQICQLNSQKKKICSCADGYQSVGSKCFAKNVPDGPQGKPLILFQDGSSIKWISTNGSKISTHSTFTSPNHTGILGVDFDHLNDTVCWISHSNVSHTMKCGLSNRLEASWNKRPPYIFSFRDVYHLTFDWISTNIYFLDDGLEMIFVCNEDLDICKIVIDSNISKPRGIALDPMEGYMFFTVWGRSGPKLERAFLDGSGRQIIVSKKIVYPHGLTLDMPTKAVYWVDKFLDSIERVNYDGTNRRTLHRGVQHLQDITVFQNDIFFISMHDKSINKIDKYSPSTYSTLANNLTKPFSLKVYHRVRQPRAKHPCMTHRGGNPCQDFCFPIWKKGTPVAKCGCKDGFVLKSNTTCVEETNSFFMVYIKSHSGIIKSASLKNGEVRKFNNGVMIPIVKKGSYSALGFDYKTRTVFYSDIGNFRIYYKGMNQSQSKIFVNKDIGHVGSIAVDWLGRNLYWVDETIPAIYVAQISNPTVKKLLVHSNLKRPGPLALSPITGTMFWATLPTNMAKSDGAIEKAWMDGTHSETIVQGLGSCVGLTIDPDNKYLYWLDASKLVVQRVQLSNHLQVETLLRINTSLYGEPTSFAYCNETFYIAAQGKVMKANAPKALADSKNVAFTIVAGDEDVSKFLIFDATNFQRGKNKCAGHSCQDLCLATAGKAGMTCACREGYTLQKDGRSCRMDASYVDPLKCGPDEFKCSNLPKCIPQTNLCDGADNCGDFSDEAVQHCDRSYIKQGFCSHGSFHCVGSGLCIPFSYVCDGHPHCPDLSDEFACTNGTVHCSEFEFQCKITKRCIPKSWVCDGTTDCGLSGTSDTSDEHEQCVYPECSELQFKCHNSSSCIPLELVCDGIKDCPGNGEDEHPTIDCHTHCDNRSNTFYCELDNKCVNKCDGICDCMDAKDETDCPGKMQPDCARIAIFATHDFECDFDVGPLLSHDDCFNVSCGIHSFRCHDGSQCIPLKARCDGYKDCKRDGGSDEEHCPTQTVPCTFPSRLCDNGSKCIPINQVCDNKFDCMDKSDEGKRCSDKSCASANCSMLCNPVPEGPLCHCPNGKHVNPTNPSQCIDTHPCDNFGTCSQLCWKFGGSRYQCLCHPGYALREDGITCSSTSNESPYLVFSNRHELRGLYLNSTSIFQSLISNLRNSIALDFLRLIEDGTDSSLDHNHNGKYDIFWSDVVDDKIYRGSLVSGSLINIQIVIEKGLATAEGLAVDWIGENIYWVESSLDQIEVAKLNGTLRQTLISGDMVSPRSIAVDANVGLLFWSDWQTEAPRIERASMSGKFRSKVFNVGSSGEGAWPNGLTLDYMLQRIYWVDARLDSIHTVKYDGMDYQTVLQDHDALSHPFSITLFESMLVWTDWRSNSVMMANKFHGGNVTTIHKTYTQPFDVKILHQTRQPRKIVNPCGKKNGNCSHLCLLSVNGTHDCGCPHLMTLSNEDNRTCITNEKMLLFSRLNEIRAVYYDKPYYHAAPPISYPLIVMPANLHFVARDKQVYWSDSQSGETKRSNLTNPALIETLIDAAAGKPLAMGVDWISNLIFIVVQTPSHNSISVTNLEGQFFSNIIQGKPQDLKNVNSLAVNPYRAQLFWPEGVDSGDFKIEMASMDGSKRKVLSNSRDNSALENPASLSYDFTSERLYWVNLNTAIIQYYDFHTKEIKRISFGDMKPHVITVYGNSIFFASEKHDAILKGDKASGGVDGFEFVRNYTESIYSIKVYDPEEQKGSNPCAVAGSCQHLCIPLLGKRICKCALGYALDDKDPTKCRSIEPVLVFSDSQGIKGISPFVNQTDDLLVPIPLVSFATDIDVDEANEFIFWLDSEQGKISRIRRDGTHRQTIHVGLTSVSGLTVDWVAGNLYWGNPKDSYIEVSRLNGSSHHILITDDLDKPISLAIDVNQGLLFWADIVKGHIERSSLDGLNRKKVIDVKASEITLDLENQRIYWCTSNDNIESSNYDGSNKKRVYSGALSTSQLHSPIVDKGFLYFVDIGETGGTIMSLSLKNYSMVHAVRKDLGVTIKDLSIFSKGRQKGRNGCSVNNGDCEDLCFWNGTTANCVCAHGKLGNDGKSCKPFDAFIAYSQVNSIATAHLTKEITPNDPYPVIQSSDHIRNAIGLAYDYANSILFFSDVQLGTINRVYFNGTGYGVVIAERGSVEGLYFEASHSDLYWTCSNDASINRINPRLADSKNSFQKLIKLNANDKPRGISVDPCESRVYWTNWDSSRPSIQRAYLSGYGIESIITTEIRMPNSLALDQAARRLYWVDARLDKIERTNLDGSNRVIVARHNPKHAFSLAIYQDYIIWTDWVRLAVLRANKYTGENVEILRQNIAKPMGIVAVSPQDVVCTSNPCNVLNGGCPDICVYNENHEVVCECGPSKRKQPDGQCVIKSNLEGRDDCDEWTCRNGQCVDNLELCNGVDNCGDNSDEEKCGVNECYSPGSNPCSPHKCIDKLIGFECSCNSGYELSFRNKTNCEVVDECLKKRPCSQKCETSVGSFKCSCVNDYVETDGVCKAKSNIPFDIMFTNQYYIRLANVNNGSLISQNLTNSVALDFHWDFGCIYWSDVTALGSSIKRSCTVTNRSEDIGKTEMNEQVLHHSISSPDGIAVDWIAQNLYWCDKGTNTIEVSRLDGRYRKVIISGLQDPRAIVVDPQHGYLYWTDWGEEPIIGKAGMDGSRVQTLISENLGWPNALTISVETEEIWWADAKVDYIAVADLNGMNMRIVHSRAQSPGANLHHIFSITTFEDYIYWSDWETKTIERCHKYTGAGQISITKKLIHRPMDVKVFHPFRQKPLMKKNPCENNGGCQNLCLLSPEGGRVCACPENFILNDDQTSCTSNCTTAQFVCESTSKCIPKWWKCDSQCDCGVSARSSNLTICDDEPASCPVFNCEPGHIQFDNNTCLYPTAICDGRKDTIGGEDEVDCNSHICLSTHYKCQGNDSVQSKCIPSQHKCDGNKDCAFGDDEEACTPVKCPSTQFQCTSTGKCIQTEWVCDLENDCGDNSDELNCTSRVCADKFRCNSGKCIPKTWTCDSEKDCSSGEDEATSECEQHASCEPSYYLCKNSNKCIPSRWKCDYEGDCPEGDDELECIPRNCSESEFKCGDGRCIHSRLLCNNIYDCEEGTDESNCDVTCNNLLEFTCVSPQTCLPKKFVCDGEFDCLDASDERNCDGNASYCDGFRCEKSTECIPYAWLCDGASDCLEGEDEEMCDKSILTHAGLCSTTKDEFQCSDMNCISMSRVCDAVKDCDDDEIGCPECPFRSCSQQCSKKKHAAVGAFTCECVEGYQHEFNRTRCSAKGEPATLVIASEDHLLRLNKPHDVDHVDLLISTTPTKIHSVDFYIDEDGNTKLYWSNNKSIQMMYITSSEGNSDNSVSSRSRRSTSSTDIISGLDVIQAICIDWIAKLLFYVEHKTISASSLDGKTRMVILKGLTEPFDIAVDPSSGKIYWTDLTDKRIYYAAEDGSGMKGIIFSPRPTGITVDHPAGRLYFTDIRSQSIESTTLEGKERIIIQRFTSGTLGWLKPFKLDVFEDTLYFTNYSSNKIMRISKFGIGNVSDITYGMVKASDVVLIQQYKHMKTILDYCADVHCPGGLCLRNGSSSAACICSNQKSPSGSPTVTECSNLKTVCDLKCNFGGKCMFDENGRKFCKCQKGYSGSSCEKNSYDYNNENLPPNFHQNTTSVDLCLNRVCRNGGTCEVIEQIAFCRCPINWIGINCEIEASFQNPCQGWCLHDGLCVLPYMEQPKECKCINGRTGSRCELNPICTNIFCFNGGTCMANPDSRLLPTCKCTPGFYGMRCDRPDIQGKIWSSEEDSGLTWMILVVFILVALSVASFSGCVAFLVMRRKGRPFMHRRMQDSGTVEINNPMFLKDEGDEDHASEPSLIFDSDKVLLQGTNFANPVYDMYKEGETSTSNDEKKGLLDHPLADPLA